MQPGADLSLTGRQRVLQRRKQRLTQLIRSPVLGNGVELFDERLAINDRALIGHLLHGPNLFFHRRKGHTPRVVDLVAVLQVSQPVDQIKRLARGQVVRVDPGKGLFKR